MGFGSILKSACGATKRSSNRLGENGSNLLHRRRGLLISFLRTKYCAMFYWLKEIETCQELDRQQNLLSNWVLVLPLIFMPLWSVFRKKWLSPFSLQNINLNSKDNFSLSAVISALHLFSQEPESLSVYWDKQQKWVSTCSGLILRAGGFWNGVSHCQICPLGAVGYVHKLLRQEIETTLHNI